VKVGLCTANYDNGVLLHHEIRGVEPGYHGYRRQRYAGPEERVPFEMPRTAPVERHDLRLHYFRRSAFDASPDPVPPPEPRWVPVHCEACSQVAVYGILLFEPGCPVRMSRFRNGALQLFTGDELAVALSAEAVSPT
jgi:hypothetical protein